MSSPFQEHIVFVDFKVERNLQGFSNVLGGSKFAAYVLVASFGGSKFDSYEVVLTSIDQTPVQAGPLRRRRPRVIYDWLFIRAHTERVSINGQRLMAMLSP